MRRFLFAAQQNIAQGLLMPFLHSFRYAAGRFVYWIIVATLFFAIAGCVTMTKERLESDGLQPIQDKRLTLPIGADLLIYVPTGISGTERTVNGLQVGLPQKLDEVVFSAAQKYFKNAEHYSKNRRANFVLLVKGYAYIHPGLVQVAITTHIDGKIYDTSGKLLYQGRGRSTEEMPNRSDKTISNAIHNTHTKAAMAFFDGFVSSKIRTLTQLNTTAPPATFELPALQPGIKIEKFATGSGILISSQGQIITSRHVVNSCVAIEAETDGKKEEVNVIATDAKNDLAVLSSRFSSATYARFSATSSSARLGEEVIAIGFPLAGVLSRDPSLTVGNVSALAGIKDDKNFYQITAPVQPGSSGGPLIAKSGALRGMVQGKLNAIAVAEFLGDIPQNVNFAVKEQVLLDFLKAHDVTVHADVNDATVFSTPDLAESATRYTVRLTCSGIPANLIKIEIDESPDS